MWNHHKYNFFLILHSLQLSILSLILATSLHFFHFSSLSFISHHSLSLSSISLHSSTSFILVSYSHSFFFSLTLTQFSLLSISLHTLFLFSFILYYSVFPLFSLFLYLSQSLSYSYFLIHLILHCLLSSSSLVSHLFPSSFIYSLS